LTSIKPPRVTHQSEGAYKEPIPEPVEYKIYPSVGYDGRIK